MRINWDAVFIAAAFVAVSCCLSPEPVAQAPTQCNGAPCVVQPTPACHDECALNAITNTLEKAEKRQTSIDPKKLLDSIVSSPVFRKCAANNWLDVHLSSECQAYAAGIMEGLQITWKVPVPPAEPKGAKP